MQRHDEDICAALRAVFNRAGLAADHVGLAADRRGQVLVASGRYADGTPFATISQPFVGDPVRTARLIATNLLTDHGGPTPELPNPRRTMGKLETVGRRIHELRNTLEARADQVLARIDAAERRGDQAFALHEGYLDAQEADLAELETSINQLTNGCPPLGNSSEPSAGNGQAV
jgi:hypothetical protein